MTLNEVIQPSRLTVTQIVGHMRDKTYYVDHSFQRRLVWTERQKARLIETILIGYPMPEVYLWQQPVDAATGQQRFSIVDGQQRLTSILQYVSNEYALKSGYLNEENQAAIFTDTQWKDLKDDLKTLIWNYVINVRTIPQNVAEEEIRLIFTRLNETDKSLNPQERRNAQFDGQFVAASVALADTKELKAVGVFVEKDDIRRMEDVEFASQLLIYERAGITSDTPKSINNMYDKYNDEYAERDVDLAAAKKKLQIIADVFALDENVRRFFASPNHLYTLYCVTDILKLEDPKLLAEGLAEFVVYYNEKRDAEMPTVGTYREGASYRTRSKTSREKRVYSLLTWVKE